MSSASVMCASTGAVGLVAISPIRLKGPRALHAGCKGSRSRRYSDNRGMSEEAADTTLMVDGKARRQRVFFSAAEAFAAAGESAKPVE
jgi:hypothetical protein